MEIVLKDIDGNEILSPSLTQWDQGVSVIVRNYTYTADQVHFHFYNMKKDKIVEVTPIVYTDNTGAPCLSGDVPNILLQEPDSIIMHVYVAQGGSATNPQASTASQTVFTAQIHVEPRMQPANFVPLDNTGSMTVREIQDNLRMEIERWENDLSAFYGTTPIPADIECYYDIATQTMYSNKNGNEYSNPITGYTGLIYQDRASGMLYFYENDTWVERTVSGAIYYCKSRADACDNTASLAQTALRNEFSDALDGCVVRVDTSAPNATSYVNETRPVITFVIGE